MLIADTFPKYVEEAYKLRDMIHHIQEQDRSTGIFEYFDFFCEHMDVHPGEVVTSSRNQEYVLLRNKFTAFVREQSDGTITYKEIGQLLGFRDHSTIIHSEEQHAEWMIISNSYKQDYLSLNKMWRLRNET